MKTIYIIGILMLVLTVGIATAVTTQLTAVQQLANLKTTILNTNMKQYQEEYKNIKSEKDYINLRATLDAKQTQTQIDKANVDSAQSSLQKIIFGKNSVQIQQASDCLNNINTLR